METVTGILLTFFFFTDTATTEIYTLSLHDALPIYRRRGRSRWRHISAAQHQAAPVSDSSEEHTSELQSLTNVVCRLLLEQKKSWMDYVQTLIERSATLGEVFAAGAVDFRVILFFFFNDTATTEIYTLSLHDALPIFTGVDGCLAPHLVQTAANTPDSTM